MRTIDKINYYLTKENKNGADLCEYLGVSSGVYSQWNTGRTHPRKSKLPIIAEYLGVEVSDIQGDDTNKKEKPTAQGGELTEKDVALINMKPLTEEQKQQAMDIAKRIDICVKESGMKKQSFTKNPVFRPQISTIGVTEQTTLVKKNLLMQLNALM